MVLFLKADVVVSPTYVKFGEDSGVFHIINEFRNQEQQIGVLDGVRIQVSIVLTWAKGTIFFGDKEERGGLWEFGWDDASCL